jgi:hypothetical protein
MLARTREPRATSSWLEEGYLGPFFLEFDQTPNSHIFILLTTTVETN